MYIGAAISAYQTDIFENCEWYDWEKRRGIYPRPEHFKNYLEDFKLAKTIGLNALRFSIEWSDFENRIDFYANYIQQMKEFSLEPFLTLHHFTNPKQIFYAGGWLKKRTIGEFLKYVEKASKALNEVKYWITFNEPMVYVTNTYILNNFPSSKNFNFDSIDFQNFNFQNFKIPFWKKFFLSIKLNKNIFEAKKALENIVEAHRKAYDLIHSNIAEAKVSIAHNYLPFEISDETLIEEKKKYDATFNEDLIFKLKEKIDFLGINYYTRNFLTPIKFKIGDFKSIPLDIKLANREYSDMGWEIYPEGLSLAFENFKKYGKPFFILENGIATRDEKLREKFFKLHIEKVLEAKKKGFCIEGYFVWSLIDNYEWNFGIDKKFGLIEVDFATKKRKIRPVAFKIPEFFKGQSFKAQSF